MNHQIKHNFTNGSINVIEIIPGIHQEDTQLSCQILVEGEQGVVVTQRGAHGLSLDLRA